MKLVHGHLSAFHRAFELSDISKSVTAAAAAAVTSPLKTFRAKERNYSCAGKPGTPSLKKSNQILSHSKRPLEQYHSTPGATALSFSTFHISV